jgi:hypothetical protein
MFVIYGQNTNTKCREYDQKQRLYDTISREKIRLTKPAVSGGGPDVPVGTGTPWSVVDDLTNGGGGARVAHGTWIDALLILACWWQC